MKPSIEWSTKLGPNADQLLRAQAQDENQPEYRRRELKEYADDLTVAELRSAASELADEAERLRRISALIETAQEALKAVTGL